MRKTLPFLFSVFLVFTALAETTHAHEDSCDAPCPSACLGASGGTYCDNSGVNRLTVPEDTKIPSVPVFDSGFVPQVVEDEIFHPPAR